MRKPFLILLCVWLLLSLVFGAGAAAPSNQVAPVERVNAKDGLPISDQSSHLRELPDGNKGSLSYSVTPAVPAAIGYRMGLEKQFEETSFFLKDTDFVTTTLGWAVGEPHWDQLTKVYTGTIVQTTDGGEDWIPQTVPVAETLNAVEFIDANRGWAVGTNGAVLHTADGGAHWEQQAIATSDEFLDVVFADANNGWATSLHPTHYDWLGEPDNWDASLWHTADGGSTWITQTIPISASILHAVDFIDTQTGWAVGVKYIGDEYTDDPAHRAVIYHTSDGGQSWVEQPYGAEELEVSLTSVDFIDAAHGWVAGFPTNSSVTGGFVFHTEDGGATWERQEPGGIFEPLWNIHFLDQDRGYVVGFDYISAWGPPVWRTQDGGDTWEKIAMTMHENDGLFGLFVDEERAVALGDHDYVAISTDPWGPYSWPNGEELFGQRFINVHYRFEEVFFVDALHGWVVGSRSYWPDFTGQVILHTTDGGETWETQHEKAPNASHLFSYLRLDSIHFVDTLNGWAVGVSEDMHDAILHTIDGGQTWEEQGQALYASWDLEFFDVQFLDSQEGWALATDNFPSSNIFLAHTVDGGANWEWVDTGIEGTIAVGFGTVLGGLDFLDAQHGWAAGGLGNIVHTPDGGTTWIAQTIDCGYPTCPRRLYEIDMLDTQVGWIAGEDLYHTSNGGLLWEIEDIGFGYDLQDVQFLDAQNGWLAGDAGYAAYTTNGGITWMPAQNVVTGVSLRGLSFVSLERGWLVGDGGVILTTVQVPYWPVYLPLVVR